MSDKVIPVQVAVRCRPLVPREQVEACQICVQFIPGEPQLILGKDKAFTYDNVFHSDVAQKDVYEKTVAKLVKGIFKGYNATVLAYGQTGSGKTHTMGGGQGQCTDTDERVMGIIPRVIQDLFDGIAERPDFEFTVKASYLELYKEDLLDLLVPPNKREKDGVVIREDNQGGIRLTGLTEKVVLNAEEMMQCLEHGSQGRTTGSTAMNSQSSRSHAIFTVHVERTNKNDSNDFCKAKFHLVDLAGSERAKKTQAEGERFKEGININKGLLALGNVISALGDEAQKRSHVPYRDSKLTRLLQDSLGGNSHTVMIACISPADSSMEETLSTLRYADRARKIKNKPVVNRDPQAAEIMRLKQLVQDLQMKLLQNGIGTNTMSNSFNGVTSADIKEYQDKIRELEEENHKLSQELQSAVDQNAEMCGKAIIAEVARDKFRQKLEALKRKMRLSMTILNGTTQEDQDESIQDKTKEHLTFVKELQEQIDEFEEESIEGIGDIANSIEDMNSDTPGPASEPGSRKDSLTEAFTKDHALSQAKLGRELAELNKMLAKKQDLANQMAHSEDKIIAIKDQYEGTMKNLEKEVESLQKEKELLNNQLVSAKANFNSGKISEQRRKRLQELEQQIGQLRKKMLEQSKMLKIKEQSDRQIQKLNQDIQAMKHHRVKLMKQMKEDADKFHKWKMQKDKEVMQLKAKDRKRQVEMVKKDRIHERQQTVLRRKAEEAVAANKRLKEALCRQKAAAEDRANKQEKSDMSGIGARVRKFLGQEMEVMVSVEEAKHHLQSLMADRKSLSEQLTDLKDKLGSTPPAKKKMLNNSSSQDMDEERGHLRVHIKTLEQEIDLRNAHITDLQQKLMDADQDDKSKSRWNHINTMVEAKCAMKYLLNTAVGAKVDFAKKKSEVNDARQQCEETSKTAETAEEELKKFKQERDEEIVTLKREHENKVLYLLNQLRNTTSEALENTLEEDIKERLHFQEAEIERLSDLQEQLENKAAECEALKKELTVAKYKLTNNPNRSLMPTIEDGQETSFFSPSLCSQVKTSKKLRKRSNKPSVPALGDFFDEEEEDEVAEPDADSDDNTEVDPDWQSGRTPGHHVPISRRKQDSYEKANESQEAKPLNISQCRCRGNCDTNRCKCQKVANKCGDSCKCSESLCKNRIRQLPESTTQDVEANISESSTILNTTFNLTSRGEDSSVSSSAGVLQEQNNLSSSTSKPGGGEPRESLFPSAENKEPTAGGLRRKRKLLSTASSNSFFPDV